jgi:hypothetical protein
MQVCVCPTAPPTLRGGKLGYGTCLQCGMRVWAHGWVPRYAGMTERRPLSDDHSNARTWVTGPTEAQAPHRRACCEASCAVVAFGGVICLGRDAAVPDCARCVHVRAPAPRNALLGASWPSTDFFECVCAENDAL